MSAGGAHCWTEKRRASWQTPSFEVGPYESPRSRSLESPHLAKALTTVDHELTYDYEGVGYLNVVRRCANLMQMSAEPEKTIDREQRILDAVLTLLSQHGISGVSMRAVAKEAKVSLGLVNYYYSDKIALMTAVLDRVEKSDVSLVTPSPDKSPEENLRLALHRVNSAEFLNTDYLSLRLQLWALAQTHPSFEEINTRAQKRYRHGISALIRAARPELSLAEANRLAADIDIIQNGVWLTSLLGIGRPAVKRATELCEKIAFG